jgi:hypothetical protein
MRLENLDRVITCIGGNSSHISTVAPSTRQAEEPPLLPLAYDCECDGIGWRIIKKEGRTYAARCRARQHKSS